MPSPSKLAIITSSLERLIREEASYHRELEGQEQRLKKITSETNMDENHEWNMKQEVRAEVEFLEYDETRAVFPALKQRLAETVEKLEDQLKSDELDISCGVGKENLDKAKEVIQKAKRVLAE